MRNIKHHRLASVNREEESKELWAVVRRNPAFKDLHALFEKVVCSPATLAPAERVFSTSELFMRPHRANKLLSELVMIKADLH